MSRIPAMRMFADPLEGLEYQLTEFKGFASKIPRLVEEDRERRWTEIGQRPSDGEREQVDIYESEAGPEEGYGWAEYGRMALSSALALSWELFREFLVGEFMEHLDARIEKAADAVHRLRDEEQSRVERDFGHLKRRYREMLNLRLDELDRWDEVEDEGPGSLDWLLSPALQESSLDGPERAIDASSHPHGAELAACTSSG